MMLNNKRFAVFGAGALDCYFAAALARAGHSVSIIARGRHLAAIRQAGIAVESLNGNFTTFPAQVSDSPSAIGPVDAVILAVKTWQVPVAARSMIPLLSAGTKVLPLQNGIEAHEQLRAEVGEQYPLLGLCRVVCDLVEPGRVRHLALEPTIALGEASQPQLSPNAKALADALSTASVIVQTPPDMRAALWQKLLFIAAVSGVGAVSRSTVGEIRQCAPTRQLLQRVMEEVVAVASADHVVLGDDVIGRTLAFVDAMPGSSTASMQRDIMEGRPSEIEAILGVLVRRGNAGGVAAPTTEFLYASLLPQEHRAGGSYPGFRETHQIP